MSGISFDFSQQRILVTGASSGIGLEIACQLMACGAQVFALGRNPQALQQLHADGCEVLAVDVADSVALEQALDTLPVMHGLVNCAGISLLESARGITAEGFDRVMAVNARRRP